MSRLILVLSMTLFFAANAQAALRLDVDLSERELRVYDGDDLIQKYDVAVGTKEKPTPTGAFNIDKIVWNPAWHPPDEKWARGKDPAGPGDPDNPMKAVKIFFSEPDYYIHGTDALDSLGKARSHGCVRMDPDDATNVAKLLMEHGGQPRPEPWYRRILHSRSTKVVLLQNPIPMRVVN
jgi:lipoprotein-anchoring transpeptidase ErfK/SrfK